MTTEAAVQNNVHYRPMVMKKKKNQKRLKANQA